MDSRRDPVQARNDGSLDLHDIADWDQRTVLDAVSVFIYQALLIAARAFVVLLALFILLAEIALGTLGGLADPWIGVLTALSAVPALGLAAFVWYADVTTQEPLSLLVGTFLLGVLVAGFAGVLNATVPAVFLEAGIDLGLAAFFFLVVGPVEEGVKLLAVRLYPFRDDRFDAVIDGAVYGAVAGLGFATIENALYITQNVAAASTNSLAIGGGTSVVRALAGPGHVIYSAIAGYYLGLAKFNPENAGPIVIKGLMIASVIHGGYNTLAQFVPELLATVTGLGWFGGFVLFVVVFDGVFGLVLVWKLRAYRRAYRLVHDRPAPRSEPTEFEP
ncbi:PrsW family intramembrane metalloprotease [Halapricum desulfuricans]|uniref:Membrane proteinase of CAAX superfamily, regulator of anti-sigma factor n=1 Tax=Halapricum desulfuricans TaxID=2841257 RepID=A0A897NC39_9EURY|nr:PrsW family glutamic-type intramembrane protease [Halapricum desulfuricans]QSG10192.1 Membrane proteinase of CAAX superfamily, regulator of anti-sigma factor [Halapricum desulfuricans]QSG10707.1 Membrane proteinase of CAAX superfamily, regulator of anti-sigma factor [Halapricum desulfuricans]